MPFDGSGNFTRVHNWQQDRDNGIRIVADRHDQEDDNLAQGLNQTFLRNGIVPMSGNLNLNGNAIRGLAGGSAAAPSLTSILDPTSGFFMSAPGQIGMSIGGTQRGLWTASGLAITGALTLGGNLTVGGSITFTGNLSVPGTLAVTGASTFTGATAHNGGLTSTTGSFTGTLTAAGNTVLNTLTASGLAQFTGGVRSSLIVIGLASEAFRAANDGTSAVHFTNAAGSTRFAQISNSPAGMLVLNERAGQPLGLGAGGIVYLNLDAAGASIEYPWGTGQDVFAGTSTSGYVIGHRHNKAARELRNTVVAADGAGKITFAVGTTETERARITSAGSVLIGRTVETLPGGAGQLLQVGSGAGNAGLTIHSSAAGIGDLQFAKGIGSAADAFNGAIRYAHSTNAMSLWVANAPRMTLNGAVSRIETTWDIDVSAASAYRIGGAFLASQSAGYNNLHGFTNGILFAASGGGVLAELANTGVLTLRDTGTNQKLALRASSPFITFDDSGGTRKGYLQHSGNNIILATDSAAGAVNLDVAGTVRGAFTATGLNVTGTITASGVINANGGLALTGGLSLTGALTGTTASFSGAVSAASFAATGGVTVGTTLAVTGASTFAGAIFSGLAAHNGGLTSTTGAFSGALTAPSLALTAGVTVGTTLAVTGASTFTGATNHNGGLNATTGAFSGAVSTGALTVTGAIVASGDITAFSDRRVKSNIQKAAGLRAVLEMEGVTFEHTSNGRKSAGVIAQELMEVAPELVHMDDNGYFSVNYMGLTAYLIEAVKELNEKVKHVNPR